MTLSRTCRGQQAVMDSQPDGRALDLLKAFSQKLWPRAPREEGVGQRGTGDLQGSHGSLTGRARPPFQALPRDSSRRLLLLLHAASLLLGLSPGPLQLVPCSRRATSAPDTSPVPACAQFVLVGTSTRAPGVSSDRQRITGTPKGPADRAGTDSHWGHDGCAG